MRCYPSIGRLPDRAGDGRDGCRPRPHRGGRRRRALGRGRPGGRSRPGSATRPAPRAPAIARADRRPAARGGHRDGRPELHGHRHARAPRRRGSAACTRRSSRGRWRRWRTPGSIGEILVSLGPRIGFRTVISAGNETVIDAADFVACFADDPGTRVVGLFLEAVRRPAAFEAALQRLAEAGQGGDRAQGRHVRAGRAGGARPHGRAGRLRPRASRRCCGTTTRSGSTTSASGSSTSRCSRASGRRAAAASARSPTPAARASTSPTRPSRRASRCSSSPTSCARASTPSSRTSPTSATRPTAGRSTTTGSSSRACSS